MDILIKYLLEYIFLFFMPPILYTISVFMIIKNASTNYKREIIILLFTYSITALWSLCILGMLATALYLGS